MTKNDFYGININMHRNKIKLLFIASIIIFICVLVGSIIFFGYIYIRNREITPSPLNLKNNYWSIQSIDTMKFSRDLAREKLQDTSFDTVINEQIRNIALAGATHVSIATPYDEEFLPFLNKWVAAARKYKLNVWFRGNFSGWEGWFEYKKITPEEHINKTNEFILNNPEIFKDNDIFSACTECENGALQDPRNTGDIAEFKEFIINEYETAQAAFAEINKQVSANYFPMNGDVARLIMDKKTTGKLNGMVVIDHYVATPEMLADDIKKIMAISGGEVMLGEFGYPIPDIHGELDTAKQSAWINEALGLIKEIKGVVGINYWTNIGGSTALWSENGVARPAVAVLGGYFKPKNFSGFVSDEIGRPIAEAKIKIYDNLTAETGLNGTFQTLLVAEKPSVLIISAPGYNDKSINTTDNENFVNIILEKKEKNLLFKFLFFLKTLQKR